MLQLSTSWYTCTQFKTLIKSAAISVSLRLVLLALLLQFSFPVLGGHAVELVKDGNHHTSLYKLDVKPIALGLFEKTENEEEHRDEDISSKNSAYLSFSYPVVRFEKTTLSYTKKSGHLVEWPVYLKILVFRI